MLKFLALIPLFVCSGCASGWPFMGKDSLGTLPLRSHLTYADVAVKCRDKGVFFSSSEHREALKLISVRAFVTNLGGKKINVHCSRMRNRNEDHRLALLPGARIQFYEGPLSECGTTFYDTPDRSRSLALRFEIEPISPITQEIMLSIYGNWGDSL